MSETTRLNLGCGNDLRRGWINVDRWPPDDWAKHSSISEYAFKQVVLSPLDLWPWPDDSVDEILAKDFFEHLPDIINAMNQCWRMLKAGGTLTLIVPTTNGPGAWQDPTHRSFWNQNTLKYFEAGNPYNTAYAKRYAILGSWRIVSLRLWQSPAGDGEKMEAVLKKVLA